MLSKNIYPKNADSFMKWCLSNQTFMNKYREMGYPKPFDVTLRDGLQGVPKQNIHLFNINEKSKLFHNVLFNYSPKNIEIGSIVSQKVLPIFKDSLQIFNYAINYQLFNQSDDHMNFFLLVPSKKKLDTIIHNRKITHFSFITSVSNEFQLKNTRMNLEESYGDIFEMIDELYTNPCRVAAPNPYIKLYISCINQCPISGKIENDKIISRILKFNKDKINDICLSDTCGTLNSKDFRQIVDTCMDYGLPASKISLHLHMRKSNQSEIEQIIYNAFDRKITNLDVSNIDTGGCSVTMNADELTPNLSYEMYYQFLCKYISGKTK